MSKFFKLILGFSVGLFLVIQVQYFLNLGIISFILYIIEIFFFIIILVMILIGIYKWMNNPIRSHKIALWISSILLGLTVYKPLGIIDDKMIYGDNLLFAYEEGVASCSSSFSFKTNGIYIQKSFCFGNRREIGNYTINNDSIFFDTNKINQYKYGVINRKNSTIEMFLSNPLTSKDFDSTQFKKEHIQRKIEKSISRKFQIHMN